MKTLPYLSSVCHYALSLRNVHINKLIAEIDVNSVILLRLGLGQKWKWRVALHGQLEGKPPKAD